MSIKYRKECSEERNDLHDRSQRADLERTHTSGTPERFPRHTRRRSMATK